MFLLALSWLAEPPSFPGPAGDPCCDSLKSQEIQGLCHVLLSFWLNLERKGLCPACGQWAAKNYSPDLVTCVRSETERDLFQLSTPLYVSIWDLWQLSMIPRVYIWVFNGSFTSAFRLWWEYSLQGRGRIVILQCVDVELKFWGCVFVGKLWGRLEWFGCWVLCMYLVCTEFFGKFAPELKGFSVPTSVAGRRIELTKILLLYLL